MEYTIDRTFFAAQAGASAPGKVSIAGAGPGDPELLTVKALRLIRTAPAIVYDALISEEIKALFQAEALLFDVGKRAGHPDATPQEQINRLLVRLARGGLDVLRLKGGDPLVFARGGEEGLHLAAHGIPFEFVPGVTAMSGAAAGAGIPLTHRGLSHGCTLLNGHGPYLDTIDWRALVALGGTWVFLMGKKSAAEIAARLLRHGAEPALPLALVESATLPEQQVTVVPLEEAAARPPLHLSDGPGLVIVGPTVELIAELCSAFPESYCDAAALSPLPQA
jgi:uroporphyrin-III C-methyltransferase